MKKIGLLLVLFCLSMLAMAQDVILKKDGSTIQSKVMEITGTEIKYKKWSNQDGPMFSINKNEVNSINYQNGEVELIASETFNTGRMERDGRDLEINGRELSDEEVRSLLGEQNYETFVSARRQVATGRAFTPIFWVSFGLTVVFVTSGYLANEYGLVLTGAITGGIADISLPLMCIFKGIGKGRLNWLADEYNKYNKTGRVFSYQISPSIIRYNSVEKQGNALGLTLSVKF